MLTAVKQRGSLMAFPRGGDPVSSQSAGLRVEARQIPMLRRAFEDAARQVEDVIARLDANGHIQEPWLGDEVSRDVHRFYTERVMGPLGTPYAAIRAYREQLKRVAEKLQEIEDHYRRAEGENVDRWEDMLLIQFREVGRLGLDFGRVYRGPADWIAWYRL